MKILITILFVWVFCSCNTAKSYTSEKLPVICGYIDTSIYVLHYEPSTGIITYAGGVYERSPNCYSRWGAVDYDECEQDCYKVVCELGMVLTSDPPQYVDPIHINCRHDLWERNREQIEAYGTKQ
jgi:hypothetical protein